MVRAPGLLGPAELPYGEGQPIPIGYHLEKRPIEPLVIAGGITFGLSYLITLMVGLSGSSKTAPLAAIPIGGRDGGGLGPVGTF